MKVLFITDGEIENPASGSEQVAFQQATGLAARGAEVCALSRRGGAAEPALRRTVEGVREMVLSAPVSDPGRFFLSLFRQLPGAFTELQGDRPFSAAVVHQPVGYCVLATLGRMRKLPLLYVFHSPWQEEYAEKRAGSDGKNAAGRARAGMEGFAVRRAAKVVTLSRYMADKVTGLHGVPEKRIVINPGGADHKRFAPLTDREAVKARLNLPPGAVHLVTVRNLEPRMGLFNLLSAMAVLNAESPGLFHLTIGGSGPLREGLLSRVRELNLAGAVTVAGFIPAGLLADYLGAADFFVLPTEKLEGFGLVTPEAMACGTPVLGTPVGGTREILSSFDGRLLFRDAGSAAMAAGIKQAADRIFFDREAYAALRSRCREHVEKNYSWPRHVSTLWQELLTATGNRHGSR
ncbi:MAG: glycosyltransferase family 4 protein [Thermodesulfobacteriota bacterium]